MKLKYERQWETIEKICDEQEKQIDIFSAAQFIKMKKSIIQQVFNIDKYINWNIFWENYDNVFYNLKLYDWEYQQKPLLDKMIELILWDKENKL